jgi:hypothetical protein
MNPVSAPSRGDVVLRSHCVGVYALSAVPGSDQVVYTTFAEANAMARGYAAHARVCAWSSENGDHFILLADCRSSKPPGRRALMEARASDHGAVSELPPRATT